MTTTDTDLENAMSQSHDIPVEQPEDAARIAGGEDEQPVYGPSTVIAALDQLEALVEGARAVPLSAMVMLNRAEVIDLLAQAREALPEDLVAADAVVADADAVLGRADSAAELTIAEANTRAEVMLDEARDKADTLVAEATESADKLLENAREEAEEQRRSAAEEAERTLGRAREEAERLIASENISRMAEERAREIVAKARTDEAQLRRGADEYVATSLGELAHLLGDLQRRTDAGRRTIAERSGAEGMDISLDND